MTEIGGGLRLRLISDSFEAMIRDALDGRGWFNTARQHNDVTLISATIDPQVEIKPNLIGISGEDILGIEDEMGSNLEEIRWDFYIDIFAESNSLGLELAGDIRDILRGKLSSVGRTHPNFAVYDYRQATPPVQFYCDIENVEVARNRNWSKPWQQHWWTILAEVVHPYYEEEV